MTGLKVSKAELLQRLDTRSRARYGGEFPESWFEDLVRDGLVDALERGANKGLAPVYFATPSHYRRALQIKRLHKAGIRGRDAQLVQLFVRGYGVEPWQVRDALLRELIRAVEKLRGGLRSAYFQNARAVGPGHMAVVAKQMGPLDPRFEAAGLRQPPEFYLETIRTAFGSHGGELAKFFGALLLLDSHSNELPEPIRSAFQLGDGTYLKARAVFVELNRLIFRPMTGEGVIGRLEFTAISLGLMLVAEKSGFSAPNFSAILPAPQGFQNLLISLFRRLRSEQDN